jgi:hypothetical protein
MIKAIATSLIIMVLCSCQTEQERQNSILDHRKRELDSTSTDCYKQFKIYTLDSCQYIVVANGPTRWGSHKGDCTNPIHGK